MDYFFRHRLIHTLSFVSTFLAHSMTFSWLPWPFNKQHKKLRLLNFNGNQQKAFSWVSLKCMTHFYQLCLQNLKGILSRTRGIIGKHGWKKPIERSPNVFKIELQVLVLFMLPIYSLDFRRPHFCDYKLWQNRLWRDKLCCNTQNWWQSFSWLIKRYSFARRSVCHPDFVIKGKVEKCCQEQSIHNWNSGLFCVFFAH